MGRGQIFTSADVVVPRPTAEVATVLAGSTRGAAELIAAAVVANPSRTELTDAHESRPDLPRRMVRLFLSSPLGRSRPAPTAHGLDALTGLARAAVVLRDHGHHTVDEIASLTGRPAATVSRLLATVAVGAHDSEITVLATTTPTAAQVTASAQAARLLDSRRVRRRRGLVAGLVVVFLAAVAVPTVIIPRWPIDVREPGEWHYSHLVRLKPGWQLVSRSIDRHAETTVLSVPWVTDSPPMCGVVVRGVGEIGHDGQTRPTTVQGRPGEITIRPGNDVSLNWEYAAGAWATVGCYAKAAVSDEVLRSIADAVEFTDQRQLLPFTLTGLPMGYQVDTVGEGFVPTGWPSTGPYLQLTPVDDPSNTVTATVVIGPDMSRDDPSSWTSTCLDPGGSICVNINEPPDANDRPSARRLTAAIQNDVQLAADPADTATWIDADTLPST